MNFGSFRRFLASRRILLDRFEDFFRAFVVRSPSGAPASSPASPANVLAPLPKSVSFVELMMGLAAADPRTPHGQNVAEQRCRYIFRFYDRDCSNDWNVDELTSLIVDIRRSRGDAVTSGVGEEQAAIDNAVAEAIRILNASGSSSPRISIAYFLDAVGSLKLRGTSGIFRLERSIKDALAQSASCSAFP